jgi:hypothetical protein
MEIAESGDCFMDVTVLQRILMADASNPRRWWNLKQAAAYLEVHRDTLEKRARKAVKKYAKTRAGMPVIRFSEHSPYRFPIEPFKAWAEHPTD